MPKTDHYKRGVDDNRPFDVTHFPELCNRETLEPLFAPLGTINQLRLHNDHGTVWLLIDLNSPAKVFDWCNVDTDRACRDAYAAGVVTINSNTNCVMNGGGFMHTMPCPQNGDRQMRLRLDLSLDSRFGDGPAEHHTVDKMLAKMRPVIERAAKVGWMYHFDRGGGTRR